MQEVGAAFAGNGLTAAITALIGGFIALVAAANARFWTPPPAAPLILMVWLSACGMAGSDAQAACPPVVNHTAADQAGAAHEVEALPEGVFIVRMLGDCAVLRDQRGHACEASGKRSINASHRSRDRRDGPGAA